MDSSRRGRRRRSTWGQVAAGGDAGAGGLSLKRDECPPARARAAWDQTTRPVPLAAFWTWARSIDSGPAPTKSTSSPTTVLGTAWTR